MIEAIVADKLLQLERRDLVDVLQKLLHEDRDAFEKLRELIEDL